jgi:acyl transferase domain-containing protein
VAYHRGQLLQELRSSPQYVPGGMISVNLSEEEARRYLDEQKIETVQVACVNSPFNSTLSGDQAKIDEIKRCLEDEGIFAQKLNTGVAYHSNVMNTIAKDYCVAIGSLDADDVDDQISTPMISSVTGCVISWETLRRPQYWVDNLIRPVKFSSALKQAMELQLAKQSTKNPSIYLVEIGPHSTLKRPIHDTLQQSFTINNLRYGSVLNRSKSAAISTLELLGALFCSGYPISITACNELYGNNGKPPILTNCPKYSFNHSVSYWNESRFSRDFRLRHTVVADILGTPVSDWNPLEPRWRKLWSADSFSWVAHHVVSSAYKTAVRFLTVSDIRQCPSSRNGNACNGIGGSEADVFLHDERRRLSCQRSAFPARSRH